MRRRVATVVAGVLGAAVIAGMLAGCGGGQPRVVETTPIDYLAACLTDPLRVLGKTFYSLDAADEEEMWRTHPDPRDEPEPQASAAWENHDDARGTLYVYSDGTAVFIAVTGNAVWFSQEEREYDGYC